MQAVVQDSDLGTRSDGHVVDQAPECCISNVLNIVDDLRNPVSVRRTRYWLEARDVVRRHFPRVRVDVGLDDVPADQPGVDPVVQVGVGDLICRKALVEQQLAMHRTMPFECVDEFGAVEVRILLVFELVAF